jgi:hypothetical protein
MNQLYPVKKYRLSLASERGAAFFTPRRVIYGQTSWLPEITNVSGRVTKW